MNEYYRIQTSVKQISEDKSYINNRMILQDTNVCKAIIEGQKGTNTESQGRSILQDTNVCKTNIGGQQKGTNTESQE